MIYRLLCLLLCISLSLPNWAQEQPDNFEISLLTATPGNEIYNTFGHSAIRVIDREKDLDYVFDYGVFDFNAPNFVWNFMRGDLNYMLAVRQYEKFVVAYEEEKRGFFEEKLNLPEDQDWEVYRFLQENYRPENRYYLYDFLFDNCSTRIRDLFAGLENVSGPEDKKTDQSFRDFLHIYLAEKHWLQFGIDILLGARVDKNMMLYQQMFLPDYLSKHLRLFQIEKDGTTQPLLKPAEILMERQDQTKKLKIFTPTLLFSLLVLLLIFLSYQKPRIFKKSSTFFYVLFGLAGCFILFMWLGTNHYTTKANWNLVWLNPLLLLLPFLKKGKIRHALIVVLAILNVLFLLAWAFLPQFIPFAALPLIGLIFLCLGKEYQLSRQTVAV